MFYSKRMSKYMQIKSKIKFTTRFIYWCGFQFQVLYPNFLNATNSKDRPTFDPKNSAKCGANLLVEHGKHWTPIAKVTMPSLWDPQGEFNKFHSLLSSVSVHVQDKTFTVLPLPSWERSWTNTWGKKSSPLVKVKLKLVITLDCLKVNF